MPQFYAWFYLFHSSRFTRPMHQQKGPAVENLVRAQVALVPLQVQAAQVAVLVVLAQVAQGQGQEQVLERQPLEQEPQQRQRVSRGPLLR